MVLKNTILILLLFYGTQVSTRAQSYIKSLEKKGIYHTLRQNYDSAKLIFRKSLSLDSQNVFSQYSLAKVLYDQEKEKIYDDRLNLKYKNLQSSIDTLMESHKYAKQAALGFDGLSDQQKKEINQLTSYSGGEIKSQLLFLIEKEFYYLLQSVPYKRSTASLYKSQIYDRAIDADTLSQLREALLNQAGYFLSVFKQSQYEKKVTELQKELLREYTRAASLRQFGDRSGKMYEKHCREVIDLFSKEERSHILNNFYGAEYNLKQKPENIQKLKKIGEKYKISIQELLCNLNLHFGGCTNSNRHLYDDIIKSFAPEDIAYVAVQKLVAPHIYNKHFDSAIYFLKEYHTLFPERKKDLYKIAKLLNKDQSKKLRNIGRNINSLYDDYNPVLSYDGNAMFFARKTSHTGEDIYFSVRDKITHQWKEAQPVPFNINTESHEIPMALSAQGDVLYIYGNYSVIDRYYYLLKDSPQLGKGDFYFTEKRSKGWGKIEVMPFPINTRHYEGNMSATADGNAVLFSSDRPGAVGGYNPNYPPNKLYFHGSGEFNLDIYVCEKENGIWKEPINLGEVINTPYAENNPFLHPDMKTLYFSSDGHYGLGGYDIFMSKRLSDSSWVEWSEPVNLGWSINSPFDDAFHITVYGEKALVVSNQGQENYGKRDIYEIAVPEEYKPEKVVVVSTGLIEIPESTKRSKLYWQNIDLPEKKGEVTVDTTKSNVLIFLKPNYKYKIYADQSGYFGASLEIDLRGIKTPTVIEKSALKLYSLEELRKDNKGFVMTSLHFDNDSDVIREESFYDLSRLSEKLNREQKLKLVIEGHTDAVASHDYNIDLSERRANSVKQFLIKAGINQNRIEAKGYGETKPIASNKTKEGRQKNRRVEFKLLKSE